MLRRSTPLSVLSSITMTLISITVISGAVLASTPVSADNDSVIDDVNITVPTACTMNGTGTNSHNAIITPGTSNSAMGETTIKAYCNDSEGFAIYAIGYTGNTDGNNTLTSTTISPAQTIATGTGTSGDSQWAMKLATTSSPTPTYPITIYNSYDSFHTVPDDYDLVAKRMNGTDIGTGAEGSTLTSTYQVYISTSQAADTYTGQVKYVLVHPNFVDKNAYKDAVTVVFDGNGLTFPNGETTNTVKYARACRPGGTGYVANTPYTTVGTSNLNSDGTQNENNPSYSDSENVLQAITVPGADKVKVVVDYGITANTMGAIIAEGIWDGDWGIIPDDNYKIYDGENNISGTKTFIFDSDSITIYFESWATPESGYDKGIYVRVYPVYNTEQPNTTIEELPSSDCSIFAISGNYQETNPWRGKWYIEVPYIELGECVDTLEGTICTQYPTTTKHYIEDENALLDSLMDDYDSVKGTTITIFAHSPYTLKYDGNGASDEFGGMGLHQYSDRIHGFLPLELSSGDELMLLAPNYRRSGYGFIGWSTDVSAINHLSSATFYGPNETVTINQNILNSANNNHEITLYATWLQSTGNIQNWSGCSSMNINDMVALTDTRDNNTYSVAKLADGNCWMLENLRLGSDVSMNLTTTDTQSAGTLPAATTSWGTDDTSQNLALNLPEAPPVYQYSKSYTFGNYYSWATAINSTINYYNNEEIPTSICPAGWRLPSGSIFSNLLTTLQGESDIATSNIFRSYPNNFVMSGRVQSVDYWTNRSGNTSRVFGQYLTSTAPSNNHMNNPIILSIQTQSVGVGNSYDFSDHTSANTTQKYYGISIRCMLNS